MSPLPDAEKKSPRVYTLLQNVDLENVTFAQVQGVGNTISIEEMSEDAATPGAGQSGTVVRQRRVGRTPRDLIPCPTRAARL